MLQLVKSFGVKKMLCINSQLPLLGPSSCLPEQASLAPSDPVPCPTAGWREHRHFWAGCWTVNRGFQVQSRAPPWQWGFHGCLKQFCFTQPQFAVDCAAALQAQHKTRWECCLCKFIKDLRASFLSEQELLIRSVSEWCLLWFLLTHSKFFFFFLQFPYRLLTDNPVVALLKQTLRAVWL